MMSDISDILAKAALALRGVNQHELADVVTLLTLLPTAEHIAAVRGAVLTIVQSPGSEASTRQRGGIGPAADLRRGIRHPSTIIS
jgi:hypothetical protein